MRKLWFAIAICGLFCMPLFAEEYPTAEVYGGYQVLIPNLGDNMHGFAAGAEYNFSPVLGIAGDFGFGKKTVNNPGYSIVNKDYSFMAGPRLSYRAAKARAFAHVMIGGDHVTSKLHSVLIGLLPSAAGETNFRMAFGGGLEFNLTDRLAVRPAQLDLLELYNHGSFDTGLRYSAGLVFKIGSKGK